MCFIIVCVTIVEHSNFGYEQGEAKAMVERHGKGLHLMLKQLNGVVRL